MLLILVKLIESSKLKNMFYREKQLRDNKSLYISIDDDKNSIQAQSSVMTKNTMRANPKQNPTIAAKAWKLSN